MRRWWLSVLRYFGLARPRRVQTYSELALLQEHDQVKRQSALESMAELQVLLKEHWPSHSILLHEWSSSVRMPRIRADLWSDWGWSG